MISAGSQHPDEAAELINYMTGSELQGKYADVFFNSATVGVNPDCGEWPLTCRWRELILSSESTYPPTDQAFVKELMDDFFEVQDNIVANCDSIVERDVGMQDTVDSNRYVVTDDHSRLDPGPCSDS